MSYIAGEVCIVTGAARGLGKAFADALRDAGGTVVTCDVNPGCDAVVDVSDASALKAFVDEVVAAHGPVGIAVANAAVCRFSSPTSSYEQAVADIDYHLATNLRGVYLTGRAVLPAMAARGRGHVVIIGTDHLCRPADFPYTAPVLDAYDASKWGLMGLVNAWVNAYGAKGVRVNSVSMGATDTEMLRSFTRIATGAEPTPEAVASWMRPEHIADLVVDMIEEGPHGRTSTNVPIIVGRPIELAPWTPAPPDAPGHPYLGVELRVPRPSLSTNSETPRASAV
jgi:NAD(P)-dependent dehydrogenase (short-subunit alcohol dehydrogenase family)